MSATDTEDSGVALVEAMLSDFPELQDNGPFTSDIEYMRVNEAKYLVI